MPTATSARSSSPRSCNGLWDSWDEDAFIRDKESGVFFDPAKMHVLNHKGKHFQVRGPLNVALLAAGPAGAGAGRRLGHRPRCRRAPRRIVFTAQTTFEQAKEFYADVMARLPRFGRTPDEVKVMPGFYPVVAPTAVGGAGEVRLPPVADPAQRRHRRSSSTRSACTASTSIRSTGRCRRWPTPTARSAASACCSSRRGATSSRLWELCLANAGPRGHVLSIGTPEQVADEMEHWFKDGAADGFNVMPAWLPGSLEDFVDMVIPELQRRGLFRTEYEAMTLRENLGLPMPVSRLPRRTPAIEAAQ